MTHQHEYGTIIDSGACDWQIFQQNDAGLAEISLTGRWVIHPDQKPRKLTVHVRLVREEGYEAITAGLCWTRAATRKDGTWQATLRDVPRGGLYRIETVLQHNEDPIEWACRGDMVHHIGVGDIWVVTGQSNAAGYGKTPVEDGPELGLHMFAADGRWKLAVHPLGDSTRTIYPANREGANASHSPWLAFARRLKQARGYPIGIIPASLGGSPMSAWDRRTDGVLFTNMLRYISDCGSRVRGAVWYQGESDTAAEPRALYKKRFSNFVRDLRKAMKTPDLPIITVQLNRYVGEDVHAPVHSDWEAMREVQRQLSHELAGVTIFPIFEAALSDVIHNDSLGNLLIGQRAALTALGAVYGHDIAWRHPECISAVQISAKVIELTFAHVTGTLRYESQHKQQFAFALRDRDGTVPTDAYEISGKHRMRITLARSITGSATVTGAPSAHPPHYLPRDVPGYRCILGFTLPIKTKGK